MMEMFILDFSSIRRKKLKKEISMNQTFDVQGMTCAHCERAVTQAVKSVDPQAEVKVDLSANKVEVQTDQLREVIAGAIAGEGYSVA